MLQVRICAGGSGQPESLPRSLKWGGRRPRGADIPVCQATRIAPALQSVRIVSARRAHRLASAPEPPAPKHDARCRTAHSPRVAGRRGEN